MSDDGYLYDEDYDDFEGDLFWNDEGEIILAVESHFAPFCLERLQAN